jgi:hypothetical protein
MKRIIRKWLDLDEEYDRLSGAILELSKKIKELENENEVLNGDLAKIGGLKELVYAIMRCLKLRPKRTFKEVPEITSTKIVREFEVVKEK